MRRKLLALLTAGLILCGLFVLTGCGEETIPEDAIVITLYPEKAPIACENFESLVKQGFYNGVVFHRIRDDFMAQGGDPTGTGMGGSGKTIKGEFAANGVENDLHHGRGIVSMARSSNYDSASSQFFICYTDCDFLDGNYAAFGEVTQGMEIVDSFLQVERVVGSDRAVSSPTKPIRMEKVKMVSDDEEGHPRVMILMNDFLS
ncbi:MAG: peptidylprolyl isomerase [Oscillospiraceae bacterium]|nr:peptidylprolyl isomerase [Oscillospiraceae bacterium]